MEVTRVFLILIALMLTACGPSLHSPGGASSEIEAERLKQEALFYDDFYRNRLHRYRKRLAETGVPLLKAAAPFCPDVLRQHYGFTIHDITQYQEDRHFLDRSNPMRGRYARVQFVLPGSEAERAGLRPNDQLISANETPLGEVTSDGVAARLQQSGPVRLSVLRDGARHTFRLTPALACDYGIELVEDYKNINAYADGERVYVTIRMLRFTKERPEELAFVMAHEFAHNALAHMTKTQSNRLLGSLLDVAATLQGMDTDDAFSDIGELAFSEGFEREADYLGLYIAARAGVDITKAPNFFRRLALHAPESIADHYATTHPSTPERFIAMEKAVAEILEKKRGKALLKPEGM